MKLTATGQPFGETPDLITDDISNNFFMKLLKRLLESDPKLDKWIKEVCKDGKKANLTMEQTEKMFLDTMPDELVDGFPQLSKIQLQSVIAQIFRKCWNAESD
jgi:hypothetical protein